MILTLVEQSGTRREHVLEQGELSLGRDEGSTVRFAENEREVSRRQAVIRADPQGFALSDRGSSNGTFVNDRRIENAALRDGDVIRFGTSGPRLLVRISGPTPSPAITGASEVPASGGKRSFADATLFDPTRHRPAPPSLLGLVAAIVMMLVGLGSGLLVVLIAGLSVGPGAAIVGIIVAFAAAPVYIVLWLWLDRYDPEPAWALIGGLLWGAGAATFVAIVLNTVFEGVMKELTQNAEIASFLSASISAPFVEEGAKGLAVLLIFLFLRREFDGVLDGIVYAGVIALGFAATENVLYYGRSLASGGFGKLAAVFVLRGVLGPFCHAVFTSMTGIGCGIARNSQNWFVRIAAPIMGYGCAVFLHFLWNTLAGVAGTPAALLVIYFLLWVPLFFVFLVVVIWMGYRESKLIQRMLALEVVRGLLTEHQAAIVASWPKRVGWVLGSLGNPTRLRARRGFLRAATRLALSYWHAERAIAAGGETVSSGLVPIYRADVARLQPQV
jgi:RsiW-degrading membrane proteinase PrsW (M82 family)